MPELILLNLDRDTIVPLHRAAEKGDPDATAAMASLWENYRDRFPLACMLCDNDVNYPPRTQIVGSDHPDRPDELVGVPICPECFALPPMQKWGRVLRILRSMHRAHGKAQAKAGAKPKQIHYTRLTQRYPRRR